MLTLGDDARRTRMHGLALMGFSLAVTILISFGYIVLGIIALFGAAFVALVTIDAERARFEAKALETRQNLHHAYIANQQILDLSLDAICTLDRQGRFADVSVACETLWGYTPRELIGRPWIEHLYPDDRQKILEISKAMVREGGTRRFESRYIHKNGSVVDVLWSARWSPQTEMTVCIARDLTDRQRRDEQLRLAAVGG